MPERRGILWSVAALGLSAVMAQLALMQELLAVFSGNELVLGIILGEWLLLTGLGAWLGRAGQHLRHPQHVFVLAQFVVALLPLGQIFAIRALHNVLFIRGAEIGLTGVALESLALLAPYCLASGFLLTLACVILQSSSTGSAHPTSTTLGAVYVADSLGSVVGGMLFSLVLLPFLDHFALLCFPSFLNFALALLNAWRIKSTSLTVSGALLTSALAATLVIFNPDAISTRWQFPGQNVLFRAHSPYGRLVVSQQKTQLNMVENGVPILSSQQTAEAEEAVHYAMVQPPEPRRVLLIGGSFSGAVAEILKYQPFEVTCVELDPMIIQAGRQFLPDAVAHPNVRLVHTDGRLFLKQSAESYDVILVNLPAPTTSQINRFYTSEFFREANQRLSQGGVLCCAVGRYENFVSPELARLLATAHHTIGSVFSSVLMIPGGRVFFVASQRPLSTNIASLLEQRHIPTTLLKRHYLGVILAPDRLADLQRAIETPSALNTDFGPILYFHHLRHWLSQFGSMPWLAIALLGLGLAWYLGRLPAPACAIFASGFAASALEVVLLLGLQVLCGSLYRQLGIVVAMFMAGLAVGAHVMTQFHAGPLTPARSPDGAERVSQHWLAPNYFTLACLAFAIAALALGLPLFLDALGCWNLTISSPWITPTVVALLTFILGALVGLEFPLAGSLGSPNPAKTASQLYTADFAGACLGALLTSAWLVPLLGITATCALTAVLNLIGGMALVLTRIKS